MINPINNASKATESHFHSLEMKMQSHFFPTTLVSGRKKLESRIFQHIGNLLVKIWDFVKYYLYFFVFGRKSVEMQRQLAQVNQLMGAFFNAEDPAQKEEFKQLFSNIDQSLRKEIEKRAKAIYEQENVGNPDEKVAYLMDHPFSIIKKGNHQEDIYVMGNILPDILRDLNYS